MTEPSDSDIPEWALRELVTWLDALETADSYQGFTTQRWLETRPLDAITALKFAIHWKDLDT